MGKWGQAKRESTERWIETPLTIKSSVEFWAHHFNGTTYQAQECVQEEREREREKSKPKPLKEERKECAFFF